MIDFMVDLYRAVRWDSDNEIGGTWVLLGDDDDDGDRDGGDGTSPS